MYLANFNQGGQNASTIGNQQVLYAKQKDSKEFPCMIGVKISPDSDSLIGYICNIMSGIFQKDAALKEKTKYLAGGRCILRFHNCNG